MDGVLGTVMICGFNFPPRNWSLCSGQLLAISSNTGLFSLLGTFYGGDGRTNFGLPQLNGRVAVGQGQALGSGVHWAMGSIMGSDSHTLTLNEMPAHSHSASFIPNALGQASLQASTGLGESATPRNGDYLAQSVAGPSPADQPEKIYSSTLESPVNLSGLSIPAETGSVTVNQSGGSLPFNILQPSLGVNYSICAAGIYPSRN